MTPRFPAAIAPALAVALAACAADAPTTPAPREAPSLAVQGEALDAIAATVEDAHQRLLPALGDARAQTRLAGVLGRVDAALAADDAEALAASLAAARDALASEIRALGPDAAAAADLDALALTLDGVGDAVPAHLRARVAEQ